MQAGPRTIAVDLTPMLPGGENGGAKVFVLELLRLLPLLAPQSRFVLLTHQRTHEELAALDRPNVTRHCVLRSPATGGDRGRMWRIAGNLTGLLPARIRGAVTSLGYRVLRRTRRSASGGILRQLGVDLLFCPFTAPTYAESGIPVVSTVYDLQYRTYPQFFSPEDVAHRDNVFRATCAESARLAPISDYTRRCVMRESGMPEAHVRTIHLRLARRFATDAPAAAAVLRRLGLESQAYLLYPANFWRHKNHEMLLTAFGMATRAGLPADTRLVCTGHPGERQAFLARAAQALGLGERVVFPGYVSAAELDSLLSHAAGVVFPSLYEGFGLPVLEAMAAGVPVACSDRTSLPEVAAGAALLFDPRVIEQVCAAMVKLVTDPALRLRLIDSGRARAASYTDTERMAAEYWRLLQEACEPGTRDNLLEGLYEDGWLGETLDLRLAATPSGSRVELEFLLPDWVPMRSLRVSRRDAPLLQRSSFRLRRGQSRSWSTRVTADRLRLRLHPGFVPAGSGHGDGDERLLTAMLRHCRIRHPDGSTETLWDGRGT